MIRLVVPEIYGENHRPIHITTEKPPALLRIIKRTGFYFTLFIPFLNLDNVNNVELMQSYRIQFIVGERDECYNWDE